MSRIAEVLLPLPLPEAFDYAVPESLELNVGDHVIAPLGVRQARGVVVGLRAAAGGNRPLKPIMARVDDPPLPANTLAFVQWAARYAVDAPGQPLAIALRGLRADRPSAPRAFVASGDPLARPTPARLRALAAATLPLTAGAIARAAGVSSAVIKALIEIGALVEAPYISAPPPPPASAPRPASLGASQAAAAAAITGAAIAGRFHALLLDGVTGSGKTEVYLEAAAALLAADPAAQVLILLPEIALTQAVIERVERRFGVEPAQWHSALAPPRRRRAWEAVADGSARIVVGARSALFLPFRRLRLIVVDEEHDASYKQDEGFIYQARDFAVARGKIESCAVALVSATPSLETLWNARAGRYAWLRLAERHGAAALPHIELVDLRRQPPDAGHWLSPPLIAEVAGTLERGEQALLFLNRRGYAPLVLCRACGERMKAPDSDSWLVEHRYTGRLVCHLTGFSMPKPALCPRCGERGTLVSVGPGVERVAEETRLLFPDARVAIFSSDTVNDAAGARALVTAMSAGEIDILVATQVAAKGHDFPGLTLVGVVDADLGLRGGDLRAAERTFQLLTQVSGRAGRRDRPGRALVQTWAPDDPVMGALSHADRDGFVELELAERRAAGLPPFGRLGAVILSCADGQRLEVEARAFAAAAPNAAGVEIFGPADAPLALVRGRRRKRLLARADRSVDLSAYMASWRARVKVPSSVRVVVDVDPYGFL